MPYSSIFAGLIAILLSSTVVNAHPSRSHSSHEHLHTRRASVSITQNGGLTVAGLQTIAPSSVSCQGAEFPDECRTASQALPYILQSFTDYNITHAPVQAALISLMAFESGEFRYNINHWPGRPGQGTRNMQMVNYNNEYAAYLGSSASSDDVSTLMDIVGSDEHSFASAAWFITTQCSYSIRQGMWDGSQSGWEQYITSCVGTSPSESGRLEYWQKAMQVLGTPS